VTVGVLPEWGDEGEGGGEGAQQVIRSCQEVAARGEGRQDILSVETDGHVAALLLHQVAPCWN
jgi:hypothetical protein